LSYVEHYKDAMHEYLALVIFPFAEYQRLGKDHGRTLFTFADASTFFPLPA
jgi:hypothetical protein